MITPLNARVLLLTPRELRILEYASTGHDHRTMAGIFHCSHQAMRKAADRLMDKLGATTIAHAVAIALREHYIS